MLENLDKRKLAYFIGFMSGDGSYEGGKGRTERMSIGTTDIEVVKWISTNIEEFNINREVWGNNPKIGIFATKPSYRKFFSVKYSEVFKKHGILNRKADRNIFNISNSTFKYYLLGLIDADGCFSYSKRKDRDRLVAKFVITHPSLNILSKVQKFLLEELSIASTIAPKGTENCLVLHFSKLSDVIKFGDFLWSDKEAIVITRKYNNYLEFRKQYLERLDRGLSLPKEFTSTTEYGELIGSISKLMLISPDGKEYPSTYVAKKDYPETYTKVNVWGRLQQKGWKSRCKTEHEVTEYLSYVRREATRLFNLWRLKV